MLLLPCCSVLVLLLYRGGACPVDRWSRCHPAAVLLCCAVVGACLLLVLRGGRVTDSPLRPGNAAPTGAGEGGWR